jgi:hypothetical protein
MSNNSQVDLLHLQEQLHPRALNASYLDVVLHPGDMLFIPRYGKARRVSSILTLVLISEGGGGIMLQLSDRSMQGNGNKKCPLRMMPRALSTRGRRSLLSAGQLTSGGETGFSRASKRLLPATSERSVEGGG